MTDALTVARHGRQPTVLDLFSGAGGMSLGFQMAGYSIALGVEKEELPCKTHRHNFGNHCHHGRVEDITDPDAFIRSHGLDTIDVIVGGPPSAGSGAAKSATCAMILRSFMIPGTSAIGILSALFRNFDPCILRWKMSRTCNTMLMKTG